MGTTILLDKKTRFQLFLLEPFCSFETKNRFPPGRHSSQNLSLKQCSVVIEFFY